MPGYELCGFSLWWIFPIVMIVICFVMMRGRMGSMMCGNGFRRIVDHKIADSDSAADILDKRYASGEINEEEYNEKKRDLNNHTND